MSTNGQNDVHVIELRSDTFTKPSKKMQVAMSNAEVGDAVYDEDPTTNKLQEVMADLLGKEAAIFLPSSTMSNLIAVMSHCTVRGCEFITGSLSHYHMWEQGGSSQIACVYSKQIENLDDGTFDLEKLVSYINDSTDRQCTKTQLVCIENTHNYTGGRVLPLDFIEKLGKICVENDMKLHMDGARLMNAAVASNQDVKTICKNVDSVNICFSKGLGAPVGAILAGSKEFIARAIRARSALGGGMRQSGVLTAACLVGLEDFNERLQKDHLNAKRLAEGIKKHSYGLLLLTPEDIVTNIIHVTITNKKLDNKTLIRRLKEVTEEEAKALGQKICVNFGYIDKYKLRILTHCDVSENDVDLVLKKLDYVCQEYSKTL